MSQFYKACLMVLLAMASSSFVRAQSGTTDRGRHHLTCASDDGRRHLCRADTRGGVEIERQRSGSPCIEGSTWGVNRRGIWVDRGCRADFLIRGDDRRDRDRDRDDDRNARRVITCSSNDGGQHFCDADTRRGVRMVRQRSGSPCIEGSTWGVTERGIWVDRGCRADFITGENR